jgi:hypothetical protein
MAMWITEVVELLVGGKILIIFDLGTMWGVGRWFGDNVEKRVGDEEKTLFWLDNWVDGTSLKTRFGILFELCLDKEVTVAYMCRFGWEVGGNGWRCHGRLLAWEE